MLTNAQQFISSRLYSLGVSTHAQAVANYIVTDSEQDSEVEDHAYRPAFK